MAATPVIRRVRFQVSSGSSLVVVGATPEIAIADAIRSFDEQASAMEELGKILWEKLHEALTPVAVVGDSFRVNEEMMIPEVPYEVEFDGDRYQFVKGDNGITVFELAPDAK